MTEEDYKNAIPKNCEYQDIEKHKDMMLCWGLARSVENNTPMICGKCILNLENKNGKT